MLFLRTNDSVEIATNDGQITFNTHNRKGNEIIKFKLDNGIISYFNELLITKMIPKKSINMLKYHPIKMILTDNQNVLAFQDLDCKVKFLVIDDTGKITQKEFDNLTQDDSILCYDGEDWYIDDVESISVIYYDEDKEVIDEELDEDDKFEDMELSNYIISSENGGIVINNIFVI